MFEWYLKPQVPHRVPAMSTVWLQLGTGVIWAWLALAGHTRWSRINFLTSALALTAAALNLRAVRRQRRLDAKDDFSQSTDNRQS